MHLYLKERFGIQPHSASMYVTDAVILEVLPLSLVFLSSFMCQFLNDFVILPHTMYMYCLLHQQARERDRVRELWFATLMSVQGEPKKIKETVIKSIWKALLRERMAHVVDLGSKGSSPRSSSPQHSHSCSSQEHQSVYSVTTLPESYSKYPRLEMIFLGSFQGMNYSS